MSRVLSLTPDQQVAVSHEAARILLVAPAGSGKTEVLVRRVERILESSPGEAFRLLVVTYTVKAAEEANRRIREGLGDEAWRVDCDTLHGFALDWLMRYGATVGVSPDITVYSDDVDRIALIAEYVRTLGLQEALGDNLRQSIGPVLSAIDDYRIQTVDDEVPDVWFEHLSLGLSELYEAYVSALARVGGIDFPGMLVKLKEAIEADPWILDNFVRTYRHVLVDEGQDLTPIQATLLALLSTGEVNLFLVADDRQSINGFAGGSFANAEALVGSGGEVLSLQHNFRCARTVLEAAERVAANLKSAQEAVAVDDAPPGQVICKDYQDSVAEARGVRVWIDQLLEGGLERSTLAGGEDSRVSAEDIGIIARTRWLLDPIVQELKSAGYSLSFNVEQSGFLASREGRLCLESLALMADKSDRPALRRFQDELTSLQYEADGSDPLEMLQTTEVPELLALARHLLPVRDNGTELDEVLGRLAEVFGGSTWAPDASRLEALWRDYRARTTAQGRSLKGFLRHVSRAQLAKPTDPGIRVLTIHRVKGLEFRAVALVGAHDGALPDYRAKKEDDLNAERRSLYVAMTRARRALHISWARIAVDRWGREHVRQPSRFLREAKLVR